MITEVEIYPITDREKSQSRSKKIKKSRKEQVSLNRRNSTKQLVRNVNHNFKIGDLFAHMTYDKKPKSADEASRDITNYIRRITSWMKKHMPDVEFKYIAIIETADKKNYHHHIFMSGVPREVAEDKWKKGRCNIDRLVPDAFGFEAAARYVMKENTRRRKQSANIKIPPVRVKDSKFKNEKAAERFVLKGDDEILKAYGCDKLLDLQIVINEYTGKPSYYIKMRRRN